MKQAILGAGAIGGLVGTALASLGEEVTLLLRPGTGAGYPATLTLERPLGSISAAVRTAEALSEPVDVLWIATKTYQLQAALQSVKEVPGCIVPLLNGVDHVEALRARFGAERVVPGTIAVEAEKTAPGRFLQRSPFVRLSLAASGEALLGPVLAGLSGLGFACQFVASEPTLLWSKLCFLAPFALVTSASGLSSGEILALPEWKQRLADAVTEACTVANASGAAIDLARQMAIVEGMPGGMRSSMQKDLAAGRPLELDALAGPILRGGKLHGIRVSTTAGLVEQVTSTCR